MDLDDWLAGRPQKPRPRSIWRIVGHTIGGVAIGLIGLVAVLIAIDSNRRSLAYVQTPGGVLSVGRTWDESLPVLQAGKRVSFTLGHTYSVDVREFTDGSRYRLTFEREPEVSPFVLARIQKER